jgi:hypothetical protein
VLLADKLTTSADIFSLTYNPKQTGFSFHVMQKVLTGLSAEAHASD